MNATDAVLTARHLTIPELLATRYRSAGRMQGLDLDDLHSIANEAFAKALARWHPERSPPGPDPLGGWLVNCTEWALKNAVWLSSRYKNENHWRARVSLDAPMRSSDPCPWLNTAGREDRALIALEEREEIEYRLRLLFPHERRVLLMLGEGHRQKDVAVKLRLSRQRVQQIVKKARQKLEEVTT